MYIVEAMVEMVEGMEPGAVLILDCESIAIPVMARRAISIQPAHCEAAEEEEGDDRVLVFGVAQAHASDPPSISKQLRKEEWGKGKTYRRQIVHK